MQLSRTAAAAPGLHPDVLIGPLAGFLAEEQIYASLEAGSLLAGDRRTPQFVQNKVEVDSNGVKYTQVLAGSPAGPSITMNLQDHLRLAYQRGLERLWHEQVQRDFRTTGGRQSRGRRNRLEWSVPFPRTSRPLRRLIGDEGAKLKIHGQLKTTIGGKSQWTEGEVQTVAGRPSKFPSLSMDQEQQFTVEGKVGELIDIRINQDTQSVGSAFGSSLSDQLANQIKLDYKGDDDAIFQEIQAGNTTLSLPGTRFVGFRQQHKGLFGIRAKGRLGPLGFTTIASHEKSKGNRKTFRGGARADTSTVRDYEYFRYKFFFLDPFYRDHLPDFHQAALGAQIRPEDAIDPITLEVFINDFNTRNDAETLAKEGVAWVDLERPIVEKSGFVERGTWHRLDPDDGYALVSAGGYIILNRVVGEREALAVSYRTRGGQQFGRTRGDTLKLKLIKARDPRPDFPTWNLEWKNVYRIGSGFSRGKKFDRDAIEVQILKEVPGREPRTSQGGKSYLQIFGLDDYGQDLGSRPDQRIDVDYVGLDELLGLLILPDLTPFNPQHPAYQTLQDTIPEIYNQQQRRDQIEASRYLIQVVSSSAQQRINLGLGVNPASVEVLLNGERLEAGRDYNIGFAGEVTFTGGVADRVGLPGADLEISFESENLLGLGSQQKTLVGLRTEYEFWEGDGTIGSTLIYNNERTGNRRIRVGAEPARTLVWDMDLKTRFKAPVLTRVVDALPLLKTASPSDINLQAEIAQSRPNLNTKGTGFIDDFEGSEQPSTLFLLRSRWTVSSEPDDPFFNGDNRGHLIWYNPFDRVRRTDIWPGQENQLTAQDNNTDVLLLELDPTPGAAESWGGIMSVFSIVNDFSQSKFLEVWLRGERGVLHIDLGNISEDVNNDNRINTEDIPVGGLSNGDGQVSPEEDIGIDGRDLVGELNHYLEQAGADTTGLSEEEKKREFGRLYPERDPEDPEGDNFAYSERNRDDYSHINGTEGNANERGTGTRPDTEDLNNDGSLNNRNDYYHYTIDLASDPHVPGTESNGWRLYRLSLYGQEVERVGSPDSSRVEYSRLTFANDPVGADEKTRVEIALMEIIGNEWQEDDVAVLEEGFVVGPEEGVNVTVVGTDKNIGYQAPPRVKIRRNPNSRTLEREQSLVLEYQDLEPGHQVSATKVLRSKANYTKYTRLRMYVHGDDSLDTYVIEGDSSEIELFVRFGSDANNYYEYVSRVFPGWEGDQPGWRGNEVDIDLLVMAQLKGRLQNAPVDPAEKFPTLQDTIADPDLRDGEPAIYLVSGNPSMQQIRQLTIGLRNRSASQAHTGKVLVDELRLDEARNDPGLAAFFKVNTTLADFMNVDTEVEWQEQDFRTLNTTGRNSSDMRTSLNTSTSLHQFLPGRWGISMPLKTRSSRSVSRPRFGPNSDVELTSGEREEQRTQNTKQDFNIQVSKRAGQNWLMRWTFDQMRLGLSSSRERGFGPVQPVNNRDARSMSFNYRMPLPSPSVQLLGWTSGFMPEGLTKLRLRYLPSNLSYSMNANRQERETLRRTDADTTFHETFSLVENYTAKATPLSGLSGNYTLKFDRDLRKKFAYKGLSFGREIKRNQKADVKLTLRLTRWLDQNYNFRADYNEVNDPTRRAAQVVVDSTTGAPLPSRDITTKNSLSAKFSLKLPTLLKSVGQPSRGKSKDQGENGEPQAPFFLWRLLNFTGGYTETVSATWRRDISGRNFNLIERPPLFYQLGFEDSLRVGRAAVGLTQQDQRGRVNTLEASSGMKLPLGFSVKPSFNRKRTHRSGSTQTRLRVEEQRTFPKTTVTWSKADRIPYFKKLVNSSQVSISFQTTRTSQGEGSLEPDNLINEGKSTEFRTSWNGRLRLGPTLRIERVRSSSTDLDFELVGSADTTAAEVGTKPLRGSSGREQVATTFRSQYNLRSKGLPLLGKLRSNVDITFEFRLESEVRSSATSNAERAPISDTNAWKTSLKATYKFSDSFRGQGIVRLENNQNTLTDKTRKTRELSLTGTLFFR